MYRLDRLYCTDCTEDSVCLRQTVVTTTRRSTIGDRAFPLAASRVYNSLLSSADRLVAAVTARVQATAQDCAVFPRVRLLMPILFALRFRLLIC